ncbi:lipopolysaccharide kinase [Echinicola strongylocentroti]|uniref:Lipopolysaccharide kinase n=1 Tax=Echinicola strongylocentroti TaxID=1795355 RepID=A0A2Z4IK27_9BACT|nr:lipopolysaccharide kinase InaA family protein [Echinicola strongylocentroti]AWW31097.1 lipopolysaccharide kinase [Echinicola strongylocentroti]
MRKIIQVNSKFKHLRGYLEEIPDKFGQRGEVIYDLRNQVRIDEVNGVKLVIKSFRKIYLANRLIYAYFRPTKAKRAFEYGRLLQEHGINTPEPVAYIDCLENGMLRAGYFVSLYTDYQPLSSFDASDAGRARALLDSLAHFTIKLHQNRIFHEDYTLSNVLYQEQDGGFDFTLIDNNRLKFASINEKLAAKSLNRLGFQPEMLTYLVRRYAEISGMDALKELKLFYDYKYETSLKYQTKNKLKRLRNLLWDREKLESPC